MRDRQQENSRIKLGVAVLIGFLLGIFVMRVSIGAGPWALDFQLDNKLTALLNPGTGTLLEEEEEDLDDIMEDDDAGESPRARKPKLADGCWAVYLDVGSNVGTQVRKLFEGEKYPKSKVLPYFRKHFGDHERRRQPGRVCAFGFEANPKNVQRLKALEECYNSKGWRTRFLIPRAVSNEDNQTIDFVVEGSVYKVSTVHLGRFINDEIAGRLLPDGYEMPGPVYAKFDIGGAEFQTFAGMVMTGSICEVTEASVEFHTKMFQKQGDVEQARTVKKMMDDLSRLRTKFTGCRTMKIDSMEDEMYFASDGMPPPKGCAAF